MNMPSTGFIILLCWVCLGISPALASHGSGCLPGDSCSRSMGHSPANPSILFDPAALGALFKNSGCTDITIIIQVQRLLSSVFDAVNDFTNRICLVVTSKCHLRRVERNHKAPYCTEGPPKLMSNLEHEVAAILANAQKKLEQILAALSAADISDVKFQTTSANSQLFTLLMLPAPVTMDANIMAQVIEIVNGIARNSIQPFEANLAYATQQVLRVCESVKCDIVSSALRRVADMIGMNCGLDEQQIQAALRECAKMIHREVECFNCSVVKTHDDFQKLIQQQLLLEDDAGSGKACELILDSCHAETACC